MLIIKYKFSFNINYSWCIILITHKIISFFLFFVPFSFKKVNKSKILSVQFSKVLMCNFKNNLFINNNFHVQTKWKIVAYNPTVYLHLLIMFFVIYSHAPLTRQSIASRRISKSYEMNTLTVYCGTNCDISCLHQTFTIYLATRMPPFEIIQVI